MSKLRTKIIAAASVIGASALLSGCTPVVIGDPSGGSFCILFLLPFPICT